MPNDKYIHNTSNNDYTGISIEKKSFGTIKKTGEKAELFTIKNKNMIKATRNNNDIKNAYNKIDCFSQLIRDLKGSRDIITFVSDKQIERVMDILTLQGIKHAKITEEESAKNIVNEFGDTERQDIIRRFQTGDLQVLVGIKCLDEGIDIKNARIAILLSNSTNPREYVQRIGRVIRYAPNKKVSVIYDLIVLTDNEAINLKEAKRALSIAENAKNKVKL